jgi:predicted deacetylase
MTLLLSLHDVAPPFQRQLHELWLMCVTRGVRPALLVVPNWHGEHPLQCNTRFVDWLYARVDQGARIFLHGERHDEAGSVRRLSDEWRALGRTAREGEFLSLGDSEASARIGRGLEVLARCGLSPIGFVPPAWLARSDAREAARDAGLALFEDERRIHWLREGRSERSAALRWSTRSRWRADLSALVAEARWVTERQAPLVRLALHPADVDDAVVRRSLDRALDRWLSVRSADGYGSLLSASRPHPGSAAA